MGKERKKNKSIFVRMTKEDREKCKRAKGRVGAESLSVWARNTLLHTAEKILNEAS